MIFPVKTSFLLFLDKNSVKCQFLFERISSPEIARTTSAGFIVFPKKTPNHRLLSILGDNFAL